MQMRGDWHHLQALLSRTFVGASNLQPATSSSAQMGIRPGGTHTTVCPCVMSAALQLVVGCTSCSSGVRPCGSTCASLYVIWCIGDVPCCQAAWAVSYAVITPHADITYSRGSRGLLQIHQGSAPTLLGYLGRGTTWAPRTGQVSLVYSTVRPLLQVYTCVSLDAHVVYGHVQPKLILHSMLLCMSSSEVCTYARQRLTVCCLACRQSKECAVFVAAQSTHSSCAITR